MFQHGHIMKVMMILSINHKAQELTLQFYVCIIALKVRLKRDSQKKKMLASCLPSLLPTEGKFPNFGSSLTPPTFTFPCDGGGSVCVLKPHVWRVIKADNTHASLELKQDTEVSTSSLKT